MMMINTPAATRPTFSGSIVMKEPYGIDDMVALLYSASHKEGSKNAEQWIRQMELYLNGASDPEEHSTLFAHGEGCLKSTLQNFVQATARFEELYKANCPMAGILPSPMIDRFKRIAQQATLILGKVDLIADDTR